MGECIDVTAQLTDVLVRGNLSQDDAECVAEEFVASGMPRRTVLASQATQPPADEVDLRDVLAAETNGLQTRRALMLVDVLNELAGALDS